MKGGKKSIAETIFYSSLNIIKEQSKNNEPLEIFKKALENVAPVVEVKSKRIGGATYQVPIEVSQNRRFALAMRWILSYSRSRKGKTMANRLASELIAASNKDGSAYKKKEDTHKMAEANKAFAHFR
jgi:small subunit ribosomal protein S7